MANATITTDHRNAGRYYRTHGGAFLGALALSKDDAVEVVVVKSARGAYRTVSRSDYRVGMGDVLALVVHPSQI